MIERLKEIVRGAGALFADAGGVRSGIHVKPGDSNFVTQYDVAVQRYLIEHLRGFLPGCSFVGEEEDYADRLVGQGDTFIMDPIDGTTNLICDYQCSCVSVALTRARQTVAGVVYNPFRDELLWAEAGKGAYLNGQRLRLPDVPMEQGVIDFGTAAYAAELRDNAFALARAVSDHAMDLREMGSAAMSLCYAAMGRNVLYYSPQLMVWDYAAADLLIREAGGVTVRGDNGGPLDYASKVPVLGGSPTAVRQFLEIEREVLRRNA